MRRRSWSCTGQGKRANMSLATTAKGCLLWVQDDSGFDIRDRPWQSKNALDQESTVNAKRLTIMSTSKPGPHSWKGSSPCGPLSPPHPPPAVALSWEAEGGCTRRDAGQRTKRGLRLPAQGNQHVVHVKLMHSKMLCTRVHAKRFGLGSRERIRLVLYSI